MCKGYFPFYSLAHTPVKKKFDLFLVLNLTEFESFDLWVVACLSPLRANFPLLSFPNLCPVRKGVLSCVDLTHLMSRADFL